VVPAAVRGERTTADVTVLPSHSERSMGTPRGLWLRIVLPRTQPADPGQESPGPRRVPPKLVALHASKVRLLHEPDPDLEAGNERRQHCARGGTLSGRSVQLPLDSRSIDDGDAPIFRLMLQQTHSVQVHGARVEYCARSGTLYGGSTSRPAGSRSMLVAEAPFARALLPWRHILQVGDPRAMRSASCRSPIGRAATAS
jgi:hypothetical protein